jgi:uncharacterized protein (DUF1697 family)
LRTTLLERLTFEADLMICEARAVRGLTFPETPGTRGASHLLSRCVTILARRPRVALQLPLQVPPSRDWQLRVIRVEGCFALSHWRRRIDKPLIDPNSVIEKRFGVRGTTRNWNTILRIQAALGA